MKLVKSTRIIAIIGIILAFISAIIFWINGSYGDVVSIASTIISIILGLISIVYTYVSGEETLKTLNEIKKENRSLVEKINYELAKNNYDEANIESLLKK